MQLVPRGARGGLYILAAEGSGYLHNRACTDACRSSRPRRTGWERWQSLVDCSCLESSRACKRPGGSNPSRSATTPQVRRLIIRAGPAWLRAGFMAACQIRARCGVVWVLAGLPQSCSRHGSNSISNGALPLTGGVQIDESSAGTAVAHPVHQFAQGRPGLSRQHVAGMTQIMKVHPGRGFLGSMP